jgi:hypothetical protein
MLSRSDTSITMTVDRKGEVGEAQQLSQVRMFVVMH